MNQPIFEMHAPLTGCAKNSGRSNSRPVASSAGMALPLLLLALVLLVPGCGYHFTGEGAGPRPGLKLIAIPVFENETSEPDLGALMSGSLRREFMRRGDMAVVPEEAAEAIFRGRITNISTTAVAKRDLRARFGTQLTLEARLFVTLEIRCVDAKTNTVLWADPNFTFHTVYRQINDPDNPDPIFSFDNRRQALDKLSQEMSVRIHDRFLSNF